MDEADANGPMNTGEEEVVIDESGDDLSESGLELADDEN